MKNALEDGYVIPGAGAFEVAVHLALKKAVSEVKGKARLGLQAYADGMLVIPKTLAQNSGNVAWKDFDIWRTSCGTRSELLFVNRIRSSGGGGVAPVGSRILTTWCLCWI